MGFLPLFSPTNAWENVRLVGLILQISPSPQIMTEAREESTGSSRRPTWQLKVN
jgi:hypothetical protein